MKNALPLPEERKLTVIYRVEPGCLGPEGASHIIKFCIFAQAALQTLDSNYISWSIISREDKTLPEMEYNVVGKKMSHNQAEKYLAIFGKSLDEFEGRLSDQLTLLIDKFMGY